MCCVHFKAVDKAKAMIEADPNRSYIVDVFEAGSNQKVSFIKFPL